MQKPADISGILPYKGQLTPEQQHAIDAAAAMGDGEKAYALLQADLYENLKYTDPMSNPEYATGMHQLESYAKGTLTPEDRAREYEALGHAQNFAQGETGAIAQDAAARGGGGAGVNSIRQQVAGQGAATRLGSADVATAGMAAERARAAQSEFTRQMQMNTAMQNQFAQQKMGGQANSLAQLRAIEAADAERKAQQEGQLTNLVAQGLGFAVGGPAGAAGAGKLTSPEAPTVSQPGYSSSGNVGFSTPGTSLPPPAAPIDNSGGAMTASEAAVKAYQASLPFADMAAPGSAPSTSSHSPFDIPNDPTLPRKVVMPSGTY